MIPYGYHPDCGGFVGVTGGGVGISVPIRLPPVPIANPDQLRTSPEERRSGQVARVGSLLMPCQHTNYTRCLDTVTVQELPPVENNQVCSRPRRQEDTLIESGHPEEWMRKYLPIHVAKCPHVSGHVRTGEKKDAQRRKSENNENPED